MTTIDPGAPAVTPEEEARALIDAYNAAWAREELKIHLYSRNRIGFAYANAADQARLGGGATEFIAERGREGWTLFGADATQPLTRGDDLMEPINWIVNLAVQGELTHQGERAAHYADLNAEYGPRARALLGRYIASVHGGDHIATPAWIVDVAAIADSLAPRVGERLGEYARRFARQNDHPAQDR